MSGPQCVRSRVRISLWLHSAGSLDHEAAPPACLPVARAQLVCQLLGPRRHRANDHDSMACSGAPCTAGSYEDVASKIMRVVARSNVAPIQLSRAGRLRVNVARAFEITAR